MNEKELLEAIIVVKGNCKLIENDIICNQCKDYFEKCISNRHILFNKALHSYAVEYGREKLQTLLTK